jgi:hypothetical protein
VEAWKTPEGLKNEYVFTLFCLARLPKEQLNSSQILHGTIQRISNDVISYFPSGRQEIKMTTGCKAF